jgi:peptidylprolyl isomerase
MDFDVFISYSSKDKATADALCSALEAAHVRCWIAPRDITPGADWGASIVSALDGCRAMVLVFSNSANRSKQVNREVQRACQNDVPIIPLRIEDVTPTDSMAFFMGPVQWLDALSPPLQDHLEHLAKVVKGVLAKNSTESELPSGSRSKVLDAVPSYPASSIAARKAADTNEPASPKAGIARSDRMDDENHSHIRQSEKSPVDTSFRDASAPNEAGNIPRQQPIDNRRSTWWPILIGAVLAMGGATYYNFVSRESGVSAPSSFTTERSSPPPASNPPPSAPPVSDPPPSPPLRSNPPSSVPPAALNLPAGLDLQNTVVLDTTKGRIVIRLRPDIAPRHTERIKQLARDGYYDDVPFHRVMDGFMAQTGDGQNFNGTGGSQYPNLKAEFSNVPFKRGVVGMARSSNNDSANSQFFIMLAETSSLNGLYTVIGNVVSGMNVVDRLKKAPPGSSGGTVTDPDKMVKVQVASDIK